MAFIDDVEIAKQMEAFREPELPPGTVFDSTGQAVAEDYIPEGAERQRMIEEVYDIFGRWISKARLKREDQTIMGFWNDIGLLALALPTLQVLMRPEVAPTKGRRQETQILQDLLFDLLDQPENLWTRKRGSRYEERTNKGRINKVFALTAEGRGKYWEKQDMEKLNRQREVLANLTLEGLEPTRQAMRDPKSWFPQSGGGWEEKMAANMRQSGLRPW